MPRIRLTYWWDGHAPGDVVDVDDQVAVTLVGRIAVRAEDDGGEPAAERAEASKE
ncbi:hypothetical protein SAMN04489729_6619 [Amycolatopsis lurida]|uniref:hypothetical protein n=1 Tax=Amycolatopsis lurida TaxID=31959 RepID=UPI000895E079|nr:hypothetical protein [Amycolatopsis lurida]SEE18625.1 hypothetical protein SAMN04489729_6619 [Amycolatopsis lurida]